MSPRNEEEVRPVKPLQIPVSDTSQISLQIPGHPDLQVRFSAWDPAPTPGSVGRFSGNISKALVKQQEITEEQRPCTGFTITSCRHQHLSSYLYVLPPDVSLCIWTQSRLCSDTC